MLIHIDPADPRPIYLQIMDEVRRGVVVGLLAVDEPLPSVRQLASTLKINPNTVRQAYQELERQGVVYVRRGLGTFAAAPESVQEDRRRLAREVVARARREAYRLGLSVADLIEALREAAPEEEIP